MLVDAKISLKAPEKVAKRASRRDHNEWFSYIHSWPTQSLTYHRWRWSGTYTHKNVRNLTSSFTFTTPLTRIQRENIKRRSRSLVIRGDKSNALIFVYFVHSQNHFRRVSDAADLAHGWGHRRRAWMGKILGKEQNIGLFHYFYVDKCSATQLMASHQNSSVNTNTYRKPIYLRPDIQSFGVLCFDAGFGISGNYSSVFAKYLSNGTRSDCDSGFRISHKWH